MNVQDFRRFLNKAGRTESVADEVLAAVQVFAAFLVEHNQRGLEEATEADLDAFAAWIERAPKASASGYLWAIRYSYRFSGDQPMEKHSGELRQARVQRAPLPLKEIRGLDPDFLARLAAAGVKNAGQMLAAVYYDAGIHSVQAMAEWEPVAFRQMLVEFVERTGFDGIPPLPKEIGSTMENARRLSPPVDD